MFLILFIISLFSGGTESVEQIAFNYFASELLSENYPDVNKIYFSGQSEAEASVAGPFSQCFVNNNFSEFFYQHKKIESEKVPIDCTGFASFKRSTKSKARNLNLKIYRAVNKDDKSYVYIKVYKEKHFVDHYLIKVSSNGEVLDSCRVNEVI